MKMIDVRIGHVYEAWDRHNLEWHRYRVTAIRRVPGRRCRCIDAIDMSRTDDLIERKFLSARLLYGR